VLPERRIGGCIASAFGLQAENSGNGKVVWVPKDDHAYYIHPNGAVLNLGESDYPDYPSYTQEELLNLIQSSCARILDKRVEK